MGCVYGLVSKSSLTSDDNVDIRYVGATSGDPVRRMIAHRNAALRGDGKARSFWIRNLLNDGDDVDVIVLETGEKHQLADMERGWIADLHQCYFLSNGTKGGEGLNIILSDDGRRRISENARRNRLSELASGIQLGMHSPEAREKAAAKLRGTVFSPEKRMKYSVAASKRFEDPAERKKIADGIRGIKRSTETRAKIAAGARASAAGQARLQCPNCDFVGLPGVLAMHRRHKEH